MDILLCSIDGTGGDKFLIRSQPYAELAKIYDRVMEHIKYDEWSDYISSIFRHFGIKVKSILEIACGTGNFSLYLHNHGYDVTCTDLSLEMLKVAAYKFKENKIPPKLFAADMTSLPLKTEFDAVLCLYDSVNYLINPDDLRKTFQGTCSVIKDCGLFIFDVCTVKNSQMFFSDNSMYENLGEVKYERKCRFRDSENIQENLFIIENNGDRFIEKHSQRIYRLKEITEIISGSQFRILGVFDDFTFNTGTENSERVHFVLQKG